MLRSRLAANIIAVGVLLLVGCLGLLTSVQSAWEEGSGVQGLHKLTANIDQSQFGAASAGLSLQDANQLARKWGLPLAFAARERSGLTAGANSAAVTVTGVNASYRDFTRLHMLAGTAIADKAVAEHSRVAVISADTADQLFHSVNVIGKTCELYGNPFSIIGVYAEDESLLAKMAADGSPAALIPVSAMLDLRSNLKITSMAFAPKADAVIHGADEVSEALTAVGQQPTKYRITNGITEAASQAQSKSLLLFLPGLIAMLQLARLMLRQGRLTWRTVRRRLAALDWGDALRAERKLLLKGGFYLAFGGAGLIAIWLFIRFPLQIAPDWLPAEIIDLSFYWNKLQSVWQQQISQAGYIPAPDDWLAAAAAKLTGRLVLAGTLAGIPLALLGARLWALTATPLVTRLTLLCGIVPAAAVVTFALARWAGLDYRIEPRDFTVLSAFFAIALVYDQTFMHAPITKGELILYAENHV